MILDHLAELTTAQAFDLDAVRPGPGKPIKMYASGVGGSLAITTGATNAAADALITVDATDDVEFELPSNTKQFIMATFAQGSVNVVMDAQTNL